MSPGIITTLTQVVLVLQNQPLLLILLQEKGHYHRGQPVLYVHRQQERQRNEQAEAKYCKHQHGLCTAVVWPKGNVKGDCCNQNQKDQCVCPMAEVVVVHAFSVHFATEELNVQLDRQNS